VGGNHTHLTGEHGTDSIDMANISDWFNKAVCALFEFNNRSKLVWHISNSTGFNMAVCALFEFSTWSNNRLKLTLRHEHGAARHRGWWRATEGRGQGDGSGARVRTAMERAAADLGGWRLGYVPLPRTRDNIDPILWLSLWVSVPESTKIPSREHPE